MKSQPGWRREVEEGRLTDEQFCSYVRRFSTSSIVREVGKVSSSRWSPDPSENDFRNFAPWALAEVARVAIGYGNEHRPDATEDDIGWLCVAYTAIEDIPLRKGLPGAVASMTLRMSHTQFPYQQTQYNELCRSIALFTQTTPKPVPALKVLGDPTWQQKVLGCEITELYGAANVAVAAAMSNEGRLDMAWLDDDTFKDEDLDMETSLVRDVLNNQFVTTVPEFKTELGDQSRPDHSFYRNASYNPLQKSPIIAGLDESLLIPVPALLLRKASPVGIYYAGVDNLRHGKRFARDFSDDVGNLFEQYVGRQLDLLEDIELHEEIVYNNGQDKSVDWIAVFPDCVVLVEAKSNRPPEGVRIGDPNAVQDQFKRLVKARDQIDVTAEQIVARRQEFNDIPTDRPIVGLVVTMEPWYMADYVIPQVDSTQWPTRATYWGVENLEHLASCTVDRPGELFIAMLDATQRGEAAMSLLTGYASRTNPILEQAWQATPW